MVAPMAARGPSTPRTTSPTMRPTATATPAATAARTPSAERAEQGASVACAREREACRWSERGVSNSLSSFGTRFKPSTVRSRVLRRGAARSAWRAGTGGRAGRGTRRDPGSNPSDTILTGGSSHSSPFTVHTARTVAKSGVTRGRRRPIERPPHRRTRGGEQGSLVGKREVLE